MSKGPGGHYVVGATHNANAVAEFDLLFHEIGMITDVLNFLTNNHTLKQTECHLQHALSTTRRLTFNQNVSKLLDFVIERQNPYSVTVNVPVPLHNLLTKQAVDQTVAPRLLNCLQNGRGIYCSFSQERLVENKKMSTTVSKRKLPQFNEQPEKTPTISMKEQKLVSSKDMAEAHRNVDIAKNGA